MGELGKGVGYEIILYSNERSHPKGVGYNMDNVLLRRIEKYRVAGWRVEPDPSGIAMYGVGILFSPSGNCFSFEEIKMNGGYPDWEVWGEGDIKEANRFAMLYRLVDKFCSSCYMGQGIEKIFYN